MTFSAKQKIDEAFDFNYLTESTKKTKDKPKPQKDIESIVD